MAVTLGAKPEHGFDEPLGLMSDCHRRVEHFLGLLIKVVDQAQGGPLSVEQRGALEAALRYFGVAAPRHTQDEEESLFPRMRQSNDPRVREAMAKIDRLERDHQKAVRGHEEVEHWSRRWLDLGPLAPPETRRLRRVLEDLREIYREHIAVEDQEVFPLAAAVLPPELLAQIGHEMAERRGLQSTISPIGKTCPSAQGRPQANHRDAC